MGDKPAEESWCEYYVVSRSSSIFTIPYMQERYAPDCWLEATFCVFMMVLSLENVVRYSDFRP